MYISFLVPRDHCRVFFFQRVFQAQFHLSFFHCHRQLTVIVCPYLLHSGLKDSERFYLDILPGYSYDVSIGKMEGGEYFLFSCGPRMCARGETLKLPPPVFKMHPTAFCNHRNFILVVLGSEEAGEVRVLENKRRIYTFKKKRSEKSFHFLNLFYMAELFNPLLLVSPLQ